MESRSLVLLVLVMPIILNLLVLVLVDACESKALIMSPALESSGKVGHKVSRSIENVTIYIYI